MTVVGLYFLVRTLAWFLQVYEISSPKHCSRRWPLNSFSVCWVTSHLKLVPLLQRINVLNVMVIRDKQISFGYQRQDFILKEEKKEKLILTLQGRFVNVELNMVAFWISISIHIVRLNWILCVCLSQPYTQFAHIGKININEEQTSYMREAGVSCVLREGYNCPSTYWQNWALGTLKTIRTDTCIHLHSVHVRSVMMCWFRLGLSEWGCLLLILPDFIHSKVISQPMCRLWCVPWCWVWIRGKEKPYSH